MERPEKLSEGKRWCFGHSGEVSSAQIVVGHTDGLCRECDDKFKGNVPELRNALLRARQHEPTPEEQKAHEAVLQALENRLEGWKKTI